MPRLTYHGAKQITVSTINDSVAVINQKKRDDAIHNRLADIEDIIQDDCLDYQTGMDKEQPIIIIGIKKTDKLVNLLNEMGAKCYD